MSLYVSPDGTRYDPLALYRKLLIQSGNRINDLLTDWQGEDPLKAALAEDTLVAVTRAAFALKPFDDPEGVTDRHVLDTLAHYLEYTEGKGQRGV